MNPLAEKAASMLRNPDGTVNWKLIGMIGFGVAALAALMGYLKERKEEKAKVGGG